MGKKTENSPGTPQFDDSFKAVRKLLTNTPGMLDNITASMGDGLSIQDRSMRIVYQNKFMIDNFGSHIGDYCYSIYEKRDTACDGCPIIEAYRTGQATKALRVGVTKEGIPFRFENIASVLRNDQGEIVAGIELCRNVEDREQAFDDLRTAMEQLRQTQGQLVRAEKLAGIGQLAAGVAHEINNPAGFVLSNLGTMRDYVLEFFTLIDALEKLIVCESPGDHCPAQNIEEEVCNVVRNEDYAYLRNELPEVIEDSLQGMQRIKSIVSSLMTFANTANDDRHPVDPNELLESALNLIQDEIARKNGHIVKAFDDVPLLHADSQQLIQMFLSLLINAVQAIDGGGTVIVKCYLENDRINIEIADDGAGIPEDVLPNIFNPFFTTRDVGHGTGLGLSIAYRIIEIHDGSIDVRSAPDQGTTFTIRLPLAPQEEPADLSRSDL